MNVELHTNSKKILLTSALLSIPLVLGFTLGLMILTKTPELLLLFFLLMIPAWYFSHWLSRSKTTVNLEKEGLILINNNEFRSDEVLGYYLNENGLLYTELCIKLLSNEVIKLTGYTKGNSGRLFMDTCNAIISKLGKENNSVQQLEYLDIHVREGKVMRPVFYVLAVAIVILDFVALYMLIAGKVDIGDFGRLFLVNSLFFWMRPYMRKRKTNAN